jgi:hypothetical protein
MGVGAGGQGVEPPVWVWEKLAHQAFLEMRNFQTYMRHIYFMEKMCKLQIVAKNKYWELV